MTNRQWNRRFFSPSSSREPSFLLVHHEKQHLLNLSQLLSLSSNSSFATQFFVQPTTLAVSTISSSHDIWTRFFAPSVFSTCFATPKPDTAKHLYLFRNFDLLTVWIAACVSRYFAKFYYSLPLLHVRINSRLHQPTKNARAMEIVQRLRERWILRLIQFTPMRPKYTLFAPQTYVLLHKYMYKNMFIRIPGLNLRTRI